MISAETFQVRFLPSEPVTSYVTGWVKSRTLPEAGLIVASAASANSGASAVRSVPSFIGRVIVPPALSMRASTLSAGCVALAMPAVLPLSSMTSAPVRARS